MGLLNEGKSLSHEETMKWAPHVRKHGIIQFVNAFKKCKNRQGDPFKWGDEIEHTIVKFFDDKKEAKVRLRSHEILPILNAEEVNHPEKIKALWRPEYAAYQIESTPPVPFEGLDFAGVEKNMKSRRIELKEVLKEGEDVVCVTVYPRLGSPNFTDPPYEPTPNKGVSGSLTYPDEAINQGHPRWKNCTHNIVRRRGERPYINIPVFMDKNTKIPIDDLQKIDKNVKPDGVYVDCMCFGGGFSCLQATFQGADIEEAKWMYDQMTPFTAIMTALAASAPFYRGIITEVDCRFNVLCHTTDCRTEEERGLKPLKNQKFRLNKGRYSTIDSYLSAAGRKYNDVPLTYHKEDYEKLVENGIDHLLAEHIAHLFVRDTISMFSEKIHQNDKEEVDHFENINSTNWLSMRFKLPPPNSSIGWRVEFRPMDVQITYFENAAYVCFVILLSRLILHKKLDFLIPISKVDENFQKSQGRDAVNREHFWFKLNINADQQNSLSNGHSKEDVIVKMTINEIINGKGSEFPGLIPLMRDYLKTADITKESLEVMEKYFDLISGRASGKILTGASWMRKFVREHPEYKQDSLVTERINYDMLKMMVAIEKGEVAAPELLGENYYK